MTLHIETPLIQSRALSLITGKSILLKLDAMQPTGSFKIRGIGLACETYASSGAQRFVSSSGGNAGLAVAYAGRNLGLPVTVVVPKTTSERARLLLRLEGAEIITHGSSWLEANTMALSLLTASDAFIHPFDNPLLWQGHASMIDELARSGHKPDAIILTVGGGGLLSGVAQGLQNNGWDNIPILAVETEGAASYKAAIEAGRPVPIDSIKSLASSLGARQVCEKAVEWSTKQTVRNVLVSDQSAFLACEKFLTDHRILVEPACGAGLSVVYEKNEALDDFDKILVIVCGGVTASLEDIKKCIAGFKIL